MGTVTEIGGGNWQATAGGAPQALVEFYAPWCGFCQELAPTIDSLASRYANDSLVVGRVNGDEDGALCERFNVGGYPTTIYFKHGVECSRLVGVHEAAEYVALFSGQRFSRRRTARADGPTTPEGIRTYALERIDSILGRWFLRGYDRQLTYAARRYLLEMPVSELQKVATYLGEAEQHVVG